MLGGHVGFKRHSGDVFFAVELAADELVNTETIQLHGRVCKYFCVSYTVQRKLHWLLVALGPCDQIANRMLNRPGFRGGCLV